MKNILRPTAMSALAIALTLSLSAAAFAASPTDIQRRSINGTEYITKTYELPPGSDPAALIESEINQDGFSFTHHTTTSEEILTSDIKTVTETQTVKSEKKSLEDVLKKLPSTIAYDQDGYIGTLILDTGSISTEAAGYTTSYRTISTTETYTALMYQDPSLLPQTAVKDGVTLSLSDVSWAVTGTSLAGDSLVPTEYTATATYTKKVSSNVATGYINTATYTGEVTKAEVGSIIYTLTYIGTSLPEPEPEPVIEPDAFPLGVLMTGIAVLLALGGGVMVVLYLRSHQGVAVYNLIDDDYICIGRQRLDYKNPVIDLNEFEDVIQSYFFSFVLDKTSTRKLFGKHITATIGEIAMTHRVKEADGKYRFNLEMEVGL